MAATGVKMCRTINSIVRISSADERQKGLERKDER